ncbi:MAG: sulfate ABC transporter ATP-binding protein [Tepidisphaeraceae bacterium]
MSIEVKNVRKSFGSFTALDGVTLTVPAGKLVALLGPSGSGKTTLLRIIAGLESPDDTPDASVKFFGEDVSGTHVRQRGVGFVFQHYALFRHLTVFENIAFGLRVKPWRERPRRSEIRDRVNELLKLVQLENLGKRFPSQLSGGQRQRVALARALAVRPKVLLLDEPFGALDARVRSELRAWLRRLHDELHVTSVFVTHDQEEALEVSDEIVVMNKGRIEQSGTPDEVFHHPKTEFVMQFLGNVNLFHGRVEQGKAVFGSMVLGGDKLNGNAAEVSTANDGQSARLFVRPHELDIVREATPDAIAASVVRIQSAGPVARVELRDEAGRPVQVDLTHDRFAGLALQVGQSVFVVPRAARVFVDSGDYQI